MLIDIVILAPLLGGIVLGLAYLGKNRLHLSQSAFAVLGMIAPVISFVCMAFLFVDYTHTQDLKAFTWIDVGIFKINIGFYLDELSAIMGVFVAFLGMLIHLYSVGYMDKDEGFGKFFCYMNLFLGSMFILVLADNPILMFVGWEGVGACSYLLISFYFDSKANVKAGNKAFILNRIGDFGFLIGLISLYLVASVGGFDYEALSKAYIPNDIATFIAFCFICGALAKSAQIPLYTWLPDAMAGPTPISALIHAATMVTAGVYMVVRFDFLYKDLNEVLEVLAYIGVASALFAAIIATKATDIKKILAYSTMSQLGYMFASLAFSSQSALFHLFTHGFFKALLFLGAGSIIIALHHEQNIFKMGSLHKHKILFYPMLFGSLAISGIFPFAGFFSKDAIILGAFLNGHYVMALILLFVAGLTAYYVFRLFFLVFYSQNQAKEVHQVPFVMSFVNVILSIFALIGGGVGVFLHLEHISLTLEIIGGLVSLFVALLGIFVAYKKFYRYQNTQEEIGLFENLVIHKFYIDEIYDLVFVRSFAFLSKFVREILDAKVFDPLVMKTARLFKIGGLIYAKWTQNGLANTYAFYMLAILLALIIYLKVGL
ncbi:NADH-quinone oxidoreductase [Helicobacter enhydrae]|uniref:NADH-quinone oxidoreductase n=1 Tax=Helicobacter enhydrae TaxID=222136 RepID=A0A1B1U594_9HELI|nr:NADH-quinone oxidoreductase subunit L [Helicobacter enhydrae]ANV97929.1 NADH-quinone oxidoreductase [Helicobacter enhydrae]